MIPSNGIESNTIQFNHHVYIFPKGLHTNTATLGNERFEKFALDDFLVGVAREMDDQMIYFGYASLNDNNKMTPNTKQSGSTLRRRRWVITSSFD